MYAGSELIPNPQFPKLPGSVCKVFRTLSSYRLLREGLIFKPSNKNSSFRSLARAHRKNLTMSKMLSIPDEVVISRIHLIRDKKVMLDDDLAELYQVATRRLNEQVKRNIERFPEDFMFQLTENEWENLKSQNATSSWGGRRKIPFVFTEHGVLMLSSVLNSERAIQVNIQIMRIYARLREMLMSNKDILLKLEKLERRVIKHDQDIRVVFGYLRQLLNPKAKVMRQIGFKRKEEG